MWRVAVLPPALLESENAVVHRKRHPKITGIAANEMMVGPTEQEE
jgi:hypothetical protein